MMFEFEVTLQNESGLHARPAGLITEVAGRYQSEIKIVKDDKEFNAKSILSILTMGASKGTKLKIITEGIDAEEAAKELKELIENKFGE